MSTVTVDPKSIDVTSLTKLGSGAYRDVYALDDDHVVKVGRGRWGDNANREEVQKYQGIAEEDRRYFAAPIVWSDDYSHVVYERAGDTVFDRMRNWIWPDDPDVKVLRFEVAPRYHITDIHERNIAYGRDGKPLIIDYAQ